VTPGVPRSKPSHHLDRGSAVIARTSAVLGRIGHYLGFRPLTASHDYNEDAFSPNEYVRWLFGEVLDWDSGLQLAVTPSWGLADRSTN
jgi:hypothetical protein